MTGVWVAVVVMEAAAHRHRTRMRMATAMADALRVSRDDAVAMMRRDVAQCVLRQ